MVEVNFGGIIASSTRWRSFDDDFRARVCTRESGAMSISKNFLRIFVVNGEKSLIQ